MKARKDTSEHKRIMENVNHRVGSENVFADLGIEDAEEYIQKANLAVRINDIVADRKLTQKRAAELLGIDQPKVSLLKRGVLDAFSIERLMKFLRLLGEPHVIIRRSDVPYENRRRRRHSKERIAAASATASHLRKLKHNR